MPTMMAVPWSAVPSPEAREVLADERAIAAYRAGRTCHPLLPFADWAGCAPALGRLGSVIVAGCRDAVAARQLGFVPARGLQPALELAQTVSASGPLASRVTFSNWPQDFAWTTHRPSVS